LLVNVFLGGSGVGLVVPTARCPELVEAMAYAETGALLAVLAREAVERGLAGLEWAAGLPGTVGGAVVGNAGAFEGDVASVLRSATVLEPDGAIVERSAEWFEFEYRGSRIKSRGERGEGRGESGEYVVLAATFGLRPSDPKGLAARAGEILEWRRTRHPAGATMGSTFENPPGSHAGYLIEQAGLRGYRIGGAQISEMHGNFFMNTGGATAADVQALIEHARAEVKRQFGVELALEIELVGW
ncbi:MAG: UDP-N-acetylmuramate dehydrogenase, partial [Anaerolineae bacterium]|nr:UDP-N-acetylmuramate dehydrogenase [Anaerolineae bacterium]